MNVRCGGVTRVALGEPPPNSETKYITLPPVTTVIDAHEDSQHVPVTLSACMSELGLLELRAHAVDREKVFHFEFDSTATSIREEGQTLEKGHPDVQGRRMRWSNCCSVSSGNPIQRPTPRKSGGSLSFLNPILEARGGPGASAHCGQHSIC